MKSQEGRGWRARFGTTPAWAGLAGLGRRGGAVTLSLGDLRRIYPELLTCDRDVDGDTVCGAGIANGYIVCPGLRNDHGDIVSGLANLS